MYELLARKPKEHLKFIYDHCSIVFNLHSTVVYRHVKADTIDNKFIEKFSREKGYIELLLKLPSGGIPYFMSLKTEYDKSLVFTHCLYLLSGTEEINL